MAGGFPGGFGPPSPFGNNSVAPPGYSQPSGVVPGMGDFNASGFDYQHGHGMWGGPPNGFGPGSGAPWNPFSNYQLIPTGNEPGYLQQLHALQQQKATSLANAQLNMTKAQNAEQKQVSSIKSQRAVDVRNTRDQEGASGVYGSSLTGQAVGNVRTAAAHNIATSQADLQRTLASLEAQIKDALTGFRTGAAGLAASNLAWQSQQTPIYGMGSGYPSGVGLGFFENVLRGIGAPINPQTLAYAMAQAQFEGTSARYNPFATTFAMPGARNFNSVGVKNYTSPQQGLQATIDTLRLGYYPAIVNALRGGNGEAAIDALNASPWGSHPTDAEYYGALHGAGQFIGQQNQNQGGNNNPGAPGGRHRR